MPLHKINKLLLQILFLSLLIFFAQNSTNAQTALEQQCFNAVQGKVAWNQAGSTSWSEANLRSLCQGTTNPSATISCFQNEIRTHNDWSRGISACKPKTTTTNTNSSNSNQAYQKYIGGEPSKTDILPRSEFKARLGVAAGAGSGATAGSGSSGGSFTMGNESGLPFPVDKNYPDFYIIPLEKRPRITLQGQCGTCVAWATSTALATILANEGKYPLFISGLHMPDPLEFFTAAGRTCDGGWWSDTAVSEMTTKGVRMSIVNPASNGGKFGSSMITPFEGSYVKTGKAGKLTNHDAMRKFIATKGALVAEMDITDTFNRYTNGVYDEQDFVAKIIKPLLLINQTAVAKDMEKTFSKYQGAHSMAVVGYFKGGTLKLRDFMKPTLPPGADLTPYGNIELPFFPAFWIVQNSWGNQWGMNGLIYVAADQKHKIFEKPLYLNGPGTTMSADTIDNEMYYMLEPKLMIGGKESMKIK